MLMALPTAPPLLFGIGARILYDRVVNPLAPGSASDQVLQGLWQGILLYYIWMEYAEFVIPVAFGLGFRIALDYVVIRDAQKSLTTLLSLAVGVFASDLLAQLIEDGVLDDDEADRRLGLRPRSRERLIQLQRRTYERHLRGYEAQSEASRKTGPDHWRRIETDESDIAMGIAGGIRNLTPLDAQVSYLRSRASATDGNRRRCKEEKKWALSQGNQARAFQLSWQIKRYAALAESFNKEADAKLLDAGQQSRSNSTNTVVPPSPGPLREGSRRSTMTIQNRHHVAPPHGSSQLTHTGARYSGSTSTPPASDEWSRALD